MIVALGATNVQSRCMVATKRRNGRKVTDAEVALAVAEHGSMSAAARALGVVPSTVFRRAQKIPELRGVQDAGGNLAAHVRLRTVQLMGRAVDRLSDMLDSEDEKTVLAACRLLGGWASSGALSVAPRDKVEERKLKEKSREDRVQELAQAQCSPDEIAACLTVEYQVGDDDAARYVADHAKAIVAHARQGRAIIRARAMAMSEDPKMVAELARQHAYWSRTGYADEVRNAVESAERAH